MGLVRRAAGEPVGNYGPFLDNNLKSSLRRRSSARYCSLSVALPPPLRHRRRSRPLSRRRATSAADETPLLVHCRRGALRRVEPIPARNLFLLRGVVTPFLSRRRLPCQRRRASKVRSGRTSAHTGPRAAHHLLYGRSVAQTNLGTAKRRVQSSVTVYLCWDIPCVLELYLRLRPCSSSMEDSNALILPCKRKNKEKGKGKVILNQIGACVLVRQNCTQCKDLLI
jgi:hypothetical protein